MTCARFLLAFAVVVGALVAPVNPAEVQTAFAATDAEEPDSLAVELVPAASGILRLGSDLTVSVTLSNRTADTVAAGTATLYIGRDSVKDHVALARWITDEKAFDAPATGLLLAQVPTPALASGQSVVLTEIIVPAAAVLLNDPMTFGAHELEVRVSSAGTNEADTNEAGTEAAKADVAGDRSSITVDPGIGAPTASVAAVMPLTVASETVGLIAAAELETLTGPGGTLTRELEQADGRPIALAIDPRIILSIRVLGDSAPESAVTWLARLDRVPNVTFPLAYADSDVSATSQAGVGILQPASVVLDPDFFPASPEPSPSSDPSSAPSSAPSATPEPAPSASPIDPAVAALPNLDDLLAWNYTRTDIAWPRELSTRASDLDVFATAGFTTTLLSSANLTVAGSDSAPSPRAREGEHEVLISDDTVSALFREAVTATTTPQWQSALARLTASLATIAVGGSDIGTPQLVVASLARDSALGSFRLAETLDAMTINPWSSGASLTAALGAPPATATLLDTPVTTARVDQIKGLLASDSQTASFATVLTDPTPITGERRLALLALLSQSWVQSDADWAAAVAAYFAASGEILGSVQVDTTGTITVLADNGDLPISISNVLDVPVTVYVTVTSPRLLLSVRETRVPVTVEANSQKRASIPVQSIANGEVTIAIALTSATGISIGQTAFADVTVRAGWETAATTVLALLVGAVFIAGIVRTVRRRRSGRGLVADGPDVANE